MNIKPLFLLLLLVAPIYSQAIKNAVPDVARPLPLSSVRVTGDPLKRAQDLNADYLLKLEPDRMMAYYRKRAGLEPRAQGYPGWGPDRAALMWGPLVLAADLGPERRGGPTEPIPSLVTDEKPVTEWLQPVPDNLGVFRTAGIGRDNDGKAREVEFSPFYRLHRRTYAVYWDLYSRDEWGRKDRRAVGGTS